jgi:hypothetical protein
MRPEFEERLVEQVETWMGVVPPNDAARAWAVQLAAVIAGFEALRGQLAFEDAPSSFEAALQATKEQ